MDNNHIEYYLQKISRSESFASSPRNIRILQFLVAQAIAQKQVKEQVIGVELFKNRYKPDSNDGKVRVYMYNLRRKLSEYYKTDGINDELIFEIKKGQYNLTFVNTKHISKSKRPIIMLSILATVTLIVTFLFLLFNYRSGKQNFWIPFLGGNRNTICAVSNHFVISKRSANNDLINYHIPGVNSGKDLAQYIVENKEDSSKYSIPDFAFISQMGPIAVHHLTKWFTENNSDFKIIVETDFSFADVAESNLIFIGQFKTMNASKSFFLRESKHFKVENDGYRYIDNKEDTLYENISVNNKRIDYAMVSYMPLDNGKKAIFFASNHDIGVIATVDYLTSKKGLKEFLNYLPSEYTYFNALFKVSGMSRTVMTRELIRVEAQ